VARLAPPYHSESRSPNESTRCVRVVLMVATRISVIVNNGPGSLWYEPVTGTLQARRDDSQAVIASHVLTSGSTPLHLDGNDIVWTRTAEAGGALKMTVTDEARSNALDFVLYVNTDSGAMSESGPPDPVRVLRHRARKLAKLANAVMTLTIFIGLFAVIGGVAIAMVPVTDCSGFTCTETYPNVGIGVVLAAGGVFQAMVLYLVAGYIALKNLETSINAVERRRALQAL
jgi:hypothetical protein